MGTVYENSFKHLGSICFGALILAIVEFCKYLIESARRKED